MEGVQFREARPEDTPAVLAIKQAAIEAVDSPDYTDRQLSAWRPDDSARADFRRAIESDRFEILVAEQEREVVGYGVLNVPRKRIDAIFVHPDRGGEGVGSSLVRQFESRARIGGIDELKIVSSLNAESFYESLGYWNFGREERTIDGVDIDFAIMHKPLD
jgi:putative acetyltransferase